ncbi:MAG: hypothetical protein AB8B72_00060 [Crocinitomicaceae bacterium]
MNLVNYNFYCTNCSSQLDENGNIHLKTVRDNGEIGIMHLSTSFGTYTYTHEPIAVFSGDELVDFFCPKCDFDLQSLNHPEYAALNMRAESQFDFEILFSRKAGMHKTYIITEDGIESYGTHSTDDID